MPTFWLFYSPDKSIGSGCFFPDLDPSVNLIGHAAITEMIKLQFTTITDRIRNPQKRMSPPVPQTVVIGKKSIWVTNKINLQ
jgi:hypothetical protein